MNDETDLFRMFRLRYSALAVLGALGLLACALLVALVLTTRAQQRDQIAPPGGDRRDCGTANARSPAACPPS